MVETQGGDGHVQRHREPIELLAKVFVDGGADLAGREAFRDCGYDVESNKSVTVSERALTRSTHFLKSSIENRSCSVFISIGNIHQVRRKPRWMPVMLGKRTRVDELDFGGIVAQDRMRRSFGVDAFFQVLEVFFEFPLRKTTRL